MAKWHGSLFADRTGVCVAEALVVWLTVSVTANAQTATSEQSGSTAQAKDELVEVVVTGFRKSLESSTDSKREAVGFVDSIFAEDIGKFPDTNLAESFNRIPGITITREITGEGLNVAIRGLNTNFTRVTLNNAPVAVASVSQDGTGQNREVDLDLFPSELFSQLSVAKTSSAEMLEGGAAGTINMRMARPFDNEGMHLTYALQGVDNSKADDLGARGSLITSGTWGNFGALVGVAGVRNKVSTTGFETVGWTSLNLTPAQCGAATCNSTGGAGAGPGQLTVVPDNASTRAAGLTPGAAIDQAFLLANNPGRTIQQIDNALIPRLGRPMFDAGTKDRYNGIVSLEWRPSDDMHFFLDSMYGKKKTDMERVDMMWGVRRTSQGGLIIPMNLQVDNESCAGGCVVTSATFPNSQFLLEYRPYTEDTEFYGTNPGMTWQVTEKLSVDVQGNYTHSKFTRADPTVFAISGPTTVTYTNNGGVPSIVPDIDLNNPANFQWLVTNRGGGNEVGRVDLVDEERETETQGGRFSLTWGNDALNLKAGGAYDELSRTIRPTGNTGQWQAAVCGGNPTAYVPQPNTQPACRGESAEQIAGGVNGYPAYTGYNGSLIPSSALPGYLSASQYGFVTVNWDDFARDSNYYAIRDRSGDAGGTPTTASWGVISEDVGAFFLQLNGNTEIGTNRLRYNVGGRWVRTDQSVTSRLTVPDARNTSLPDGQRLPDATNLVTLTRTYDNWLPSGNVAWNVTDSFVVRGALSKTMTRANPADMLLGLSIPNADVSSVNLGNPALDPYQSDNIDLGFEYYTGREGYFGVAAFRKGIEGFTTRRTTTVLFSDLAQYGVTLDSLGAGQRDAVLNRGGNNAPVQLNQTVNASGRLTINGLEFNWVQPFDFLLDRFGLHGLGFTANYTIIDQRGEGAAPAIVVGVAPKTFNSTLYYENYGVSARLSVTSAQGAQNSGPNSNQSQITGAELYGDDYSQWDFSSSFELGRWLGGRDFVPQLTLDVINIGKDKRRSYFQFSNATYSEFDSGRTIMLGFRGRL